MEQNRKMILTVGISGSGKSTWATNFIERTPGYFRVNRDDIRAQITGISSMRWRADIEDLVTVIEEDNVRAILGAGYNVVVDATHLKKNYIDRWVKQFNHLCDISLMIFNTDFEEAETRVCQRDGLLRGVATDYIREQHERFKAIRNLDVYYPKKEILPDGGAKNHNECIICDLDGTLSLYDKSKSPYDRDFQNDAINEPIRQFIEEISYWRANSNDQDVKIFFFSGRNSKFRPQTLEFLNRCFGEDVQYELIMRDEKDMRRDSDIKLEMFETHVRSKYNVLCVFDDRLQVIEECWNPLGVFVFNCNQGNKRF